MLQEGEEDTAEPPAAISCFGAAGIDGEARGMAAVRSRPRELGGIALDPERGGEMGSRWSKSSEGVVVGVRAWVVTRRSRAAWAPARCGGDGAGWSISLRSLQEEGGHIAKNPPFLEFLYLQKGTATTSWI